MELSVLSKTIKKYPILSKEKECALLKKVSNRSHYHKEDVQEAIDILIYSNQKLVIKYAIYYSKKFPGLDLMDLVAWGNIGLMYALMHFKPKYNFRFSSYAVPCISHKISYYARENSSIIRHPGMTASSQKYGDGKNKVSIFSIHQVVGENFDGEGNMTLEDMIVDPNSYVAMREYEILDMAKIALELVKERERRLLHYIFTKNYTLEQTGKIYHVSKEMIRIRLRNILKKIRFRLEKKAKIYGRKKYKMF